MTTDLSAITYDSVVPRVNYFELSSQNADQAVSNRNRSRSGELENLESVVEPIAIKLIDDFHSSGDEFDVPEVKFKYWRKSYTTRTIHLANEFDMTKKVWDLENNLQLLNNGAWSVPNYHSSRWYPDMNDIVSIYCKFNSYFIIYWLNLMVKQNFSGPAIIGISKSNET